MGKNVQPPTSPQVAVLVSIHQVATHFAVTQSLLIPKKNQVSTGVATHVGLTQNSEKTGVTAFRSCALHPALQGLVPGIAHGLRVLEVEEAGGAAAREPAGPETEPQINKWEVGWDPETKKTLRSRPSCWGKNVFLLFSFCLLFLWAV